MYKFTMDFNCGIGSHANIKFLVESFGIPRTYVEVGVFEGSTLFWVADQITPLNNDFQLYAIDPHVGSIDMSEDFNDIRANFIHNLDECKHKNIKYIQKFSGDGLLDLVNAGVSANLIYVDGDHTASTVLSDLVLAWKILGVGGVILCDDTGQWKYKDKNGTYSSQMSPRLAVETFIQCNWHKLNIINLPDSSQTAFMKIAD